MRASKGGGYCSDRAGLDQYRKQLKQVACPHCRAVGWLIGHGFLRGYQENSQEHEGIRGRRFFCSNRNHRKGCGRTFSRLLADRLRGFTISSATLWAFLKGVRDGLTRKVASERFLGSFSLETAYRLWNRVAQAQSQLRSRLHRRGEPPTDSDATEPLFQLIDHLIRAFPPANDPIAAFHMTFQAPFLP